MLIRVAIVAVTAALAEFQRATLAGAHIEGYWSLLSPAQIRAARLICFMLLMQLMVCALSLALASAGKTIAAPTAVTPMAGAATSVAEES